MADDSGTNVLVEEALQVAEENRDDADKEEEEEEALRKMISGHPLYGLLVHNQMNCFKVCLGDVCVREDDNANIIKEVLDAAVTNNPSSTELDRFMETYCNALNKLKEGMEDPMKEATSFINSTHAQLEQLAGDSKETNQTSEPSITTK